jgi:Flp pilus assembly pilin Flp
MGTIRSRIREFLKADRGQDVVEYSLLLAFITLAGAASYLSLGGYVNTLWQIVNNRLSTASQ